MHPGLVEYARKANPLQIMWNRRIAHERSLAPKAYQLRVEELEKAALARLRTTSFYARHEGSNPVSSIDQISVITHKADLRADLKQFQPPRGRLTDFLQAPGSTSGSTGAPLVFTRTLQDIAIEEAFHNWWRSEIGWEPHMSTAIIRGAFPKEFRDGKVFIGLKGTGRYLLNTFNIKPETINEYLHHLREQRTDVIYGLPSSIAGLANTILKTGIDSYKPKLIVTSSETLPESVRILASEVFQCPVYDWYGLSERATAAGNCRNGRYHFFTNYAHTNVIDGELHGTPLRWRGMSFANYSTGDRVEDFSTDLCGCGWTDPHAAKTLGRQDPAVYASDGTVIGRLHHIYNGETGINGAQVIQSADGQLVISLLMPVEDRATMERIAQRLRDRVPGRKVEIQIVDQLRLNRSGKAPAVICEMEKPE